MLLWEYLHASDRLIIPDNVATQNGPWWLRTRGELPVPSPLLKPGEDITAVVTLRFVHQKDDKWTQPKTFNRMKSVPDHYFTTDTFYETRDRNPRQVQNMCCDYQN